MDDDLQGALETHRRAAQGKDGILWKSEAGECIVKPFGKGSNYRYAIQFLGVNLYLAAQDTPKKTPNAYASPSARMLWETGVTGTVESVVRILADLGGDVMQVQPSRADLAADFWIPDGMTLDFLRAFRVSRSKKTNHWEDNGELLTFYIGNKAAPVQCRIYNKLVQVMQDASKAWFLDVWQMDDLSELGPVWRVEFQLRRAFLRQVGIDSVEDLLAQAGGLWQYLTGEWLTLREPGGSNTSRRPMHLWWQAVQQCAPLFGPACDISRDLGTKDTVGADWYISHMAGCLLSYAARQGHQNLDIASLTASDVMLTYWDQRDWADAYAKKRIELNLSDQWKEGDDVPF